MPTQHDELRDELVAILGAARELTPETDRQLADAFMRYLEHEPQPEIGGVVTVDTPHQPHSSLALAGGIWGTAGMFLFLLLVLDHPGPVDFIVASVLLLSLIAGITRGLLYIARTGWRVPSVRITIAPNGKAPGRG